MILFLTVVKVKKIRPILAATSQPIWTHRATEGTPDLLVTKSMYQPGGARFRLAVSLTVVTPLTVLNGSATDRWFGSELCVTAAGRISEALPTAWLTLI